MTEKKDTYNGWTNYATWRINLELLDDWATYHTEDKDYEKFDSIARLADHLKDYAESAVEATAHETPSPNFALDYALAFMSEVNYYEIAKNIAHDFPNIINDNMPL